MQWVTLQYHRKSELTDRKKTLSKDKLRPQRLSLDSVRPQQG